jgi:hypothetical protein
VICLGESPFPRRHEGHFWATAYLASAISIPSISF